MPVISANDAMQARFRAAAEKKALEAVVRYSKLSGEDAERVAHYAVTAADPHLRTMYAQKMGGTSAQEATAAGLMVAGAVAVEVAALVAMFRRGGRKTRVLAGASIVANTGLFVYGRFKQYRIRQVAQSHLAAVLRTKAAGA